MSCTRTTEKEMRSLILLLDAALNDFGMSDVDKQEALGELALTAKAIMDEDNEISDEQAAILDAKAVR